MIGYIKGKLTLKTPTHVYIEASGVGYLVHISLYTFSKIEALEDAILYTSLIVREDSQTLYGFYDEVEKEIFNHLISVSGVGPNTGRVILSSMSTSEIRAAILTDRPDVLNKVKGVGPKTAKKIILDLKDKFIKLADTDDVNEILAPSGNTTRNEALSALVALGFNKQRAGKAIDKIMGGASETHTVEELIKLALGQMS